MVNQEKIQEGLADFCKTTKVIHSCETLSHLRTTEKMIEGYRNKWNINPLWEPEPFTTVWVLQTYWELLNNYLKHQSKLVFETDSKIRYN